MRRVWLAGLVALAGCGSGGGGSSDKGGDPTAYKQSGDAICADYSAAIAKLGQPTAVSAIGPFIDKAMPILTRTVGRIEKLDPPSDLADQYAAFRDAARKTVDRAAAMRKAAEAADATEVQRLLAEAADASKRRVGLAHAAGLEACAKL